MPAVMNGYIPQGVVKTITVGASPFSFANPEACSIEVFVNGAISVMQVNRGSSGYIDVGLLGGVVRLDPGETVQVTFIVAPTMKYYPG